MLKNGKLPPYLLTKLLKGFGRSTAMVGPKVGEDAAIVSVSDESAFIFTTDPITFTDKNIDYYLLRVNANDIAASGGIPKYLLVSLLFPKSTTIKEVKNLFFRIQEESKKMGIEVLGGHTEITDVVKNIVGIGTMIGLAKKDKLTPTKKAKPGDKILLTKQIAIEGTALIFREKEKSLRDIFSREIIEKGKRLLFNPGISIIKEAQILNQNCRVNSMHDPTEGGIATALWEISQVAKVKILAVRRKIPVLEETKVICNYYHLDPLYLLASGSLLVTLPENEAKRGIKILKKNGIGSEIIGEVKKGRGAYIIQGEILKKIEPKEDEITKII